jgi:CheY-like chemotaxis protein
VTVTLGEVLAENDGRSILIKVSDTGVGIAEDRRAGIFDSFVQADASISRRFGGSGLGLGISRSLAGLMGGTLDLDSREHVGTVVTLALPLEEVFAPALDEVVHPLLARTSPTGEVKPMPRQATILLVEDIGINQELIGEMLSRLGHKVELATNGAEALAMAGRLYGNPEMWDLIMMDVQMPVMDGLTATRAIRALGGRAATIPIVGLTANAFPAEMQDCRDAGMNDHIAKPAGFVQLREAIERWADVATTPPPANGFRELETFSIADRFKARMRKSHSRMIEIAAELHDADAALRVRLLQEAPGIAHVLAGTAAMFRQAPLGDVARHTEAELRPIARQPQPDNEADDQAPICRLIAALGDAMNSPVRPSKPKVRRVAERRS